MHTKENAIEIGTTHLVNISTRITQNACNMLNDIQTYLQTERTMPKVSKQETLEKVICHYHAYMLQEIKKQDEAELAKSNETESNIIEKLDHDLKKHEKSMQFESKQQDSLQPEIKQQEESKQIANKNYQGMSPDQAKDMSKLNGTAIRKHSATIVNMPAQKPFNPQLQKKILNNSGAK